MLEHERDYLSRLMRGRAFRSAQGTADIMHDITDIDNQLAQLPRRVKAESP